MDLLEASELVSGPDPFRFTELAAPTLERKVGENVRCE